LLLCIARSGKVWTQKQPVSNNTTHPPTQNLPAEGSIPVSLLPAAILVLVAGKATACWPTSSPEQGCAACSACCARSAAPRAPPAARRGRRPAPRRRTVARARSACRGCASGATSARPRLRAGRNLRRPGELAAGGGAAARGAWAQSLLTSGECMKRRENTHLCIALHWPGKMVVSVWVLCWRPFLYEKHCADLYLGLGHAVGVILTIQIYIISTPSVMPLVNATI
jgi:hypothetical protein